MIHERRPKISPRELRLRGMATCLDTVLTQAEQKGSAIEDVLLELLQAEHRDKQERCLKAGLSAPNYPGIGRLIPFLLSSNLASKNPNHGLSQINLH